MEERQGGDHATIAYAFAPIHKLALGVAVGLVTGLLLGAITLFHVALAPVEGPNLGLLAQYFYGYDITPAGAAIGAAWGFGTGFVFGWFMAFVRNLVVSIAVFTLRTKAELEETATFLDHI